MALADEPAKRKVFLNTELSDEISKPDSGLDSDVMSWAVLDEERNVLIQFGLTSPSSLWRAPVYTDHRVGGELRRNYQASCFMPHWNLEIPPLGSWDIHISMQIMRFKK